MRRIIWVALGAVVFLAIGGSLAGAGEKNEPANTKWSLVAIGPEGSPMPAVDGTAVTLQFGDDGRASGSGGCNSFGSDYKVHHDMLSFGPILSTKRACVDEAAMRQEQRYFEALQSAKRFAIDGERLTIHFEGGVVELVKQN